MIKDSLLFALFNCKATLIYISFILYSIICGQIYKNDIMNLTEMPEGPVQTIKSDHIIC